MATCCQEQNISYNLAAFVLFHISADFSEKPSTIPRYLYVIPSKKQKEKSSTNAIYLAPVWAFSVFSTKYAGIFKNN